MKKILFIVFMTMFGGLFVFADSTTDTQLDDAIKNQTDAQVKTTAQTLKEKFKFDKFNSCSDMESVLNEFAKAFSGQRYGGGILYDKALTANATAAGAVTEGVSLDSKSSVTSSTTDYSKTNIQVAGVDEADVIKTDGKYIYYYNQKQGKVFILKSPLDISSSTINLDNAQVLKTIKMPENFSNINLFLYNNKLVIMANRYSQISYTDYIMDRSSRTTVVIYDTSDIGNLKLLKLFDVNGSLQDSRLIGNHLYVVSQIYLNLYNYWRPIAMNSDVATTVKINPSIKASDVLPKSIELTLDTTRVQQTLTGNYTVNSSSIDCNQDIMYLLPNKETIQKYNISPSMALVSNIDLGNIDKPVEKKVLFGDVSQIHMTTDSLYLADNFWIGYNFSCPIGAMCMMPYYRGGENTLVHKFDLKADSTLSYNNSAIIPGTPLNQYSMSEDDKGNFRILTNSWWPNLNTHLFVLSKDLNMLGSYMNIKKDERFQASRFIGNMLYLVTFQQTDPLFVFDLSNPSSPKLTGELKIPGYSKYLHPYTDMTGGVQYLIGLGYDVATGSWGGVVNSGVKLDLYKIDFNKKDSDGNISVQQLYTKDFGGEGSYTDALDNPRTFVWDANKKLLVMPIYLSSQYKTKTCTTGVPGYETCYDSSLQVPSFAGIKGVSIDVDKGITESFSKDYLSMLSGARQDTVGGAYSYPYSQWEFSSLMPRVGYAGDALYMVNNLFADFFLKDNVDNSKKVYFDQSIKK